MVYEIPEFYKALALAYERAGLDESWRVAYNRVSEAVSRVERLLSKCELLELNVEQIIRGYGARMLRSIEEGNVSGVIEVYWELERLLRSIESRVNVAYIHLILARLTSSTIVMGVGLLLALRSLEALLLVPATLAILSIGVSLGSLLLILRRSSHIVLAVATLLQILSLTSHAIYSMEGFTTLALATLISVTSTIASIGVHVILRTTISGMKELRLS